MDIDREAVRKHYEILPDEDIERLAYYEAKDLSPEALEILRAEIRNRGMSASLETAVDIHVKGLGEEVKLELLTRISSFPCPLCGSSNELLNATQLITVKSLVVVVNVDKSIIISCPNCIKTRTKRTLISNLKWGWWGIPWGPIRTLLALVENAMALNSKRYSELTNEFVEFFEPHLIAIKVKIDEAKDLDGLLESINLSPRLDLDYA